MQVIQLYSLFWLISPLVKWITCWSLMLLLCIQYFKLTWCSCNKGRYAILSESMTCKKWVTWLVLFRTLAFNSSVQSLPFLFLIVTPVSTFDSVGQVRLCSFHSYIDLFPFTPYNIRPSMMKGEPGKWSSNWKVRISNNAGYLIQVYFLISWSSVHVYVYPLHLLI